MGTSRPPQGTQGQAPWGRTDTHPPQKKPNHIPTFAPGPAREAAAHYALQGLLWGGKKRGGPPKNLVRGVTAPPKPPPWGAGMGCHPLSPQKKTPNPVAPPVLTTRTCPGRRGPSGSGGPPPGRPPSSPGPAGSSRPPGGRGFSSSSMGDGDSLGRGGEQREGELGTPLCPPAPQTPSFLPNFCSFSAILCLSFSLPHPNFSFNLIFSFSCQFFAFLLLFPLFCPVLPPFNLFSFISPPIFSFSAPIPHVLTHSPSSCPRHPNFHPWRFSLLFSFFFASVKPFPAPIPALLLHRGLLPVPMPNPPVLTPNHLTIP